MDTKIHYRCPNSHHILTQNEGQICPCGKVGTHTGRICLRRTIRRMVLKDLWVSVSGAIAQQRNVETIANNVANANTPGFKKDKLTFKEHITALEKGVQDIDLPNKEWSPKDFYRSQGAERAFVQVAGSFTNHEQGQLTPTGNPLDIALSGKGMLEVLTPNGIRFTRRGILSLSPAGNLVTDQGWPVLSKLEQGQTPEGQGTPTPSPKERVIQLDPRKGKVSINLQGELFLGGNKSAALSVVEFKDLHALKKEGSSLFINNYDGNLITSGTKTAVHQGFIEGSNVNAISEMSELIKANRHFESIQRVIKAYDHIAGKAANDIAKF